MHEKFIKANEEEETVYTVFNREIKGQHIIERLKPPFLKILYNSQTKKGKLSSFLSGSMPNGAGGRRSITKTDIDNAVKKTINWAKEHITETDKNLPG